MTDELDRVNKRVATLMGWKSTFDYQDWLNTQPRSPIRRTPAERDAAAELHGVRRGLEMAIEQILFMATPEDTISDAIDEIRKLKEVIK